MTARPEFNYVTFINAPPEKVWAALTQPEFTEQFWFKSRCTGDWSEGSDYTFTVADDEGGQRVVLAGKVVKNDFPNELIYQFTCPNIEEVCEEDTLVQYLLEESDGYTKLTLRHYNFEEGSKLVTMISSGWPCILASLKSLMETGKALDISH